MNIIEELLINKKKSCTPIWFMRQAGRHLPEFRKIREKNQNFIRLCLNEELSSEWKEEKPKETTKKKAK